MKKLNLLFTALLLLCCVRIAKAEVVTIGEITYDVITKAKQAKVISGDTEYSGNIVIPSEITYNNVTCSVTSIGSNAFYECSSLASITIPNSVTSIGDGAFFKCSGLTSITIPNSVTSIGEYAFGWCSGLTSVTIPNSVTSIGDNAFGDCDRLTSITIPNSVTSIGEDAFSGCSGLESIVVDAGNTKYDSRDNCNAIIETESNTLITGCENTVIPNSVTSIGGFAFWGCSGLASVTIPNSVTSIGEYAFYSCSGLTSVTIGNSVTRIGNYAFYNCSGLTSVTIGNSVTRIGNYAFYNCSGLTSIEIPNSVTSIGDYTFYNCYGLTSITIPNSVTNIGNYAFRNCENLGDVYCLATNVPSTNSNAFSGSYPEYMKLHVPAEAIDSYKTTAPWSSFGSIVEIFAGGEMVIDGIKYDINVNTKQAKVIIGGNYSGDIVIPSEITYNNVTCSVTSIGSDAFNGCSRLTSITIPNSVTSIGKYAFCWCDGLTSITIPNSVTSIGEYAFQDCDGLTSVTIPNSVTSIGDWAFNDCDGLTSVTIGSSVTSIGNYAFSYCDGLESIVVDAGNTKYDSRENCNAIIETESNTLLYGCKNSVIPNSVTSIGSSAFNRCSGLTSITIPNSITSIGDYAFQSCSGLTSITIPNSVTSIESYAFYKCSGLTSITIGNSVTSIGDFAFSWCTSLTSIEIPNSVTSIGDGAFRICGNLTDVYCLATDVPTTESDAFDSSYIKNMKLHVPEEAIDSYKTTAPWSSFGNIVTLDGDIVETPKCDNPVIKYNNRELVIECETENAEFVTEVTSNDFKKFYSNKINFSATYNISVYATAAGYDNSDTVNATLCWIECDCDADDNTDIINIPAKAVFVTSNNGTINICCSLEGENVAVYSSDAMCIGSTTIENGCASIQSGLSKGNIAIIKIGEKSIKVILN